MRSTKYSPTPAFTSELVPLPGTKYLDFQIIISCACEVGIYKRKFEDQEKRKIQEKKKIKHDLDQEKNRNHDHVIHHKK